MFRKRIPSKRSKSDFSDAGAFVDFEDGSESVTLGVPAGKVGEAIAAAASHGSTRLAAARKAAGKAARSAAASTAEGDFTASPFGSNDFGSIREPSWHVRCCFLRHDELLRGAADRPAPAGPRARRRRLGEVARARPARRR